MKEMKLKNIEEKSHLLRSVLETFSSNYEKGLFLSISNFDLLPAKKDKDTILRENIVEYFNKKDRFEKTFDLVFIDAPFHVQNRSKKESIFKRNFEYSVLLDALKYIDNEGDIYMLFPPSLFINKQGRDLIEMVIEEGFGIDIVLRLPEKFLEPITAIETILVKFVKGPKDKMFICDLDNSNNYEEILDNYYSSTEEKNIHKGYYVKTKDFETFENEIINNQITSLNTSYKGFSNYKIANVVKDINTTKDFFIDKENSLYIPKIGNSMPVADIKETSLKHQNYFQLVFPTDKKSKSYVNSKYLEIYFKSKLGHLSLKSISAYTFIPHLNKSSLKELRVPIPRKNVQETIISTNNKLVQLKSEVNELEAELSLNPDTAEDLTSLLDNTLNILGKLNIEDRILALIRNGESKTVEFKQTFNIDVKTGKKEKYIQKSSLKNIVAFLNSEGGSLLVGVSDSGEITGIGDDLFQNDDHYLLNFKNLIKSHIGEAFYPFIDWNIAEVESKKVLVVDCRASSDPCFLEKEFYVRTNPSADKLDGPELVAYLKERFK